eukprot:CAMPEP_0117692866 /NCGR_PEP_ID=MMETSP0804-20121206/26553_1 /TAXON_ID=1074897 /ORGANISM="Tetraselmis astigmatica, Strain CCMP880" /LENGTH=219 /DNA_ID=CAMNT_0005506337 /DNA_START=308 /DNA_END=967 /DNA_ORIENTATION=+
MLLCNVTLRPPAYDLLTVSAIPGPKGSALLSRRHIARLQHTLTLMHAAARQPCRSQGLDGLRGHALRVSRWALSASPGSELSAPWLLESDLPGAELLFLGSSLSADQCQAMIQESAAPPLGCTPLRDQASITRQEREAIEKAHHGLNLPDGYYFDGFSYLDPFGDRLQEHPCMADFVAAYLAEANLAIAEKNREEAAASLQQSLQVDSVCKAGISCATV